MMLLKILIAAGPQLPALINEVKQLAEEAKSNDDAATKLQKMVTDLRDLLDLIVKAV